MMFLLDTDVLSLVHAGHEKVGQQKERIDPAEMATTIVTKMEILQARYDFLLKAADGEQLLRAQRWLQRSEELLSQILIVGIDLDVASEFNKLRR